MKRLALAILLVAACSGGKQKQDTTTSGTGSAVLAQKIVVSWGISPKDGSADVFLQTTDETGKQVSHPVGTYEGECTIITPAADMKALTGVACTAGAFTTELHAVVADGIVVLKLAVDSGVTPDPMAREEITRIKVPPGAAIEAA